tara:strand:+ start:381 stop:1193 length:813 start_codon:yes stop_codon:yes gene_type:complete
MSGLLLRWLGGGGGDHICQLLAAQNPDTYTNFSVGELDEISGRVVIVNDRDPDFPWLSEISKAHPIADKQNLKQDFIKLIQQHNKFIIKFHNFDKEFDRSLKSHLPVTDLGFGLDFLPFVVQANLEKFSNEGHPMYDLIYRTRSFHNTTLEKVGKKLNTTQKNQMLTWNMITHAMNCMHNFDLDKSDISTQDLFHDKKRIENFFHKHGYSLNMNNPLVNKWEENNTKYLPTKKYLTGLQNKDYEYDDKELPLAERYIFRALAGKSFTFRV